MLAMLRAGADHKTSLGLGSATHRAPRVSPSDLAFLVAKTLVFETEERHCFEA